MSSTLQLAAGRIDEDAKRKRQVRFGGKVFDGLRLSVFENREIVFGQVRNKRSVLVFDVEEESDQVDADFEGLNRRLFVFGLLRARRASRLQVFEFEAPWG